MRLFLTYISFCAALMVSSASHAEDESLVTDMTGLTLGSQGVGFESTLLIYPGFAEIIRRNRGEWFLAPGFGVTPGVMTGNVDNRGNIKYLEGEFALALLTHSEGHTGGGAGGLVATYSRGIVRQGETSGMQYTVSLSGVFFYPVFCLYFRHMELEKSRDEGGLMIKLPISTFFAKRRN